ncbi:unnamed protein product, partial [Effrenium voratum]
MPSMPLSSGTRPVFVRAKITELGKEDSWCACLTPEAKAAAREEPCISLVISFLIITGAFTFNWFEMQGGWHTAMQVTMTLEGILWAIAAALLARINVVVNNAAVAVGQVIICFGGIFFTISGLQDGVPGKVISLSYVLAPAAQQKKCLDPTSWAPSMSAAFADACPYYGISCFMVATAMGLYGVSGLPKTFISPFGAVACFFTGAWTIGLFGLWGPTILEEGFLRYEDMENPSIDMYTHKTFSWAWVHVMQVIGAVFLTLGGILAICWDFTGESESESSLTLSEYPECAGDKQAAVFPAESRRPAAVKSGDGPEVWGDLKTSTRHIAQLGRQNQWAEALRFLEQVPQPNAFVYSAAISACERSHCWQHALQLLEDMGQRRVRADVVCCGGLLSACEKGQQWPGALQLLQDMREAQILPNLISYSSALSACEKGQKWEHALLLFWAMTQEGLEQDVVSCSAAISACEK